MMSHSDLKVPPVLGLALEILLTSHGRSATELSRAAKISLNTVSAYIWEPGLLTRERLDELAEVLGLSLLDAERCVLAARLVQPPRLDWSPVNPTPEERRIDEKYAAMAAGEMGDHVLDTLLREHRASNRRHSLEEGRRLAQEMLKRGGRIEPGPLPWGLVMALCEASETMAPKKPDRALEIAELAVAAVRQVALDVPGSQGFRNRLESWATAFVANAQRVIGSDLPAAGRTWLQVWRLWFIGEDPAGLLSRAYLLDMEASLRRDQGNLSYALNLHEDALALARPEEMGIILLNQSVTRKENDDPTGALESLDRAAENIDGSRQPRLRTVLCFSRASSLCKLGRAKEAMPLVSEVRKLAEHLRNEIDLIKAMWLEANCLAGLGNREGALVRLEQVRTELKERRLPFDFALASLDIAGLYREEGRFLEIKVLAASVLEIFKAQQVHREAIAAAILFKEAAEKERVSLQLVQQLQEFLAKARTNPSLRFKALPRGNGGGNA